MGSVAILQALGHEPLAISGLVSCSPLGAKEAEAVTGITVLTRRHLHDPALAELLVGPVMRNAASSRVEAA